MEQQRTQRIEKIFVRRDQCGESEGFCRLMAKLMSCPNAIMIVTLFRKKIAMKCYLLLALFIISCLLVGCGLSQEQIRARDEYLYRAQVYYRNQKFLNSLQQIECALAIEPELKRALVSKGWTLYYIHKYEDAREVFLKVESVDDTDPWVKYGLGSIDFKRGLHISGKVAEFEKKIANHPELKEEFAEPLARKRQEMELYFARSLKYFEQSLVNAPGNYNLHKMIAFVRVAQGAKHYLTAIQSLDRYLNLLNKELAGIEQSLKQRKKRPTQARSQAKTARIARYYRRNLAKPD